VKQNPATGCDGFLRLLPQPIVLTAADAKQVAGGNLGARPPALTPNDPIGDLPVEKMSLNFTKITQTFTSMDPAVSRNPALGRAF
jgi:hypothetical protein